MCLPCINNPDLFQLLESVSQEIKETMTNHGCINGTLVGVKYSSPMPFIGLYAAVATSLCLLLMVHDIIVAILARKRWLPSKLFRFNSATMILLSIAVKLPVDLTTAMPSPQDQLSKLAGTVLICICMAFLMPSLGANSESERFTNMLGFSIFVITVAVNICVQIYTGVIVLFITEHIIILSFMLLLLVMLWHISSYIKCERRITNDQLNNLLAKGHSNMFDRLTLCHLYVYCSDPQFKIGVHPMNAAVSTISVICSGILVQATIRSLILKKLEFCKGNSHYDWSILYIVIVQVLTVIAGTIAIVFRWLSLFNRMDFNKLISVVGYHDSDLLLKSLRMVPQYKLLRLLESQIPIIISIAQLLIVFPWLVVRILFNLYEEDEKEIFGTPDEGVIGVPGYMAQKGFNEMTRFENQYRKLIGMGTNLSGFSFYVDTHYSGTYVNYIREHQKPNVCSLSIALLVKIAEASIPNNYLEDLLLAFKEAMEIIHFIDKMMQPISQDSMEMLSFAKDLSNSGDFTWVFSEDINRIQPDLNCSVAKLNILKQMLESDKMLSQVGDLIEFIYPEQHSSVEELVNSIRVMFVDMIVNAMLPQLPIAIYKMLNKGPVEEFEERVQFALKLVVRMLSWEEFGQINWLFPPGTDFHSFGFFESVSYRNNLGEPIYIGPQLP